MYFAFNDVPYSHASKGLKLKQNKAEQKYQIRNIQVAQPEFILKDK